MYPTSSELSHLLQEEPGPHACWDQLVQIKPSPFNLGWQLTSNWAFQFGQTWCFFVFLLVFPPWPASLHLNCNFQKCDARLCQNADVLSRSRECTSWTNNNQFANINTSTNDSKNTNANTNTSSKWFPKSKGKTKNRAVFSAKHLKGTKNYHEWKHMWS